MPRRWILRSLLVVFGLLAGAQLVPYGWERSNPPVVAEPPWSSAAVRELARRACFDCHSNETRWPWYARVAPASWLVTRDVAEGRRHLNFSEWDPSAPRLQRVPRVVERRKMPPLIYLPAHPEARLAPAERAALAAGLRASLLGAPTGEPRNGERREEQDGERREERDGERREERRP